MESKTIRKGLQLQTHTTAQFKTAAMSLSLITPLDECAAEKALLIQLLARSSKQYPTALAMNRALASLYGATLSPVVEKQGEAQILRLVLSAPEDRFALQGESICRACLKLLFGCLLAPCAEPDGFPRENVEREKRLLLEKIQSERDDKRLYALRRMIEEMCKDEPYGKSKYGEESCIEAITGKDLLSVWTDLLLHAGISFDYVGSESAERLESWIKEEIGSIELGAQPEIRTEFLTESYGSKTIREQQNVKQGKLVIGYRAGMTYDMDNYAAIRLMTAIFGGGTFSKLFLNVREKQSLCYYCSARLIRSKGLIVVESGVETENAEQALEAIRAELRDMRSGKFSDETIHDAKLSLCDSLRSVTDSSASTLSWFSSFSASGSFFTPQQTADMIENVSREEIVLAANMISEDTVYLLEREQEAKQA